MKLRKNVIALIFSILFLIFEIYLMYRGAGFRIPTLIALVFPTLVAIAWIRKKDNLAITTGFYITLSGGILFLLMIIGWLTGNFNGTGNLEGWEFIFIDGEKILTEILATIAYSIGVAKKR